MGKSPIETMMDFVYWKPVANNLPFVTHEGVLQIGDVSMRVYQLSDGRRVIPSEDIERFF
jgi:hypothetical protein